MNTREFENFIKKNLYKMTTDQLIKAGEDIGWHSTRTIQTICKILNREN